MSECPHCEYNKKRAQNWRVEAYRLAGHPLPTEENQMTRPIGISVPHRRVEEDDDIQDYKKPWVSLSEQDINELKNNLPDLYYWVDVVRATEKILKEKNNA